jgi:RIO kinase 1
MGGSRYGHELASRLWPMQEWAMLRRAAEAGVSVPYPVEQTDRGLMMEFIGDQSQAAPKLAQARLSATEVASAWDQLLENLRGLTAAGLVHADLSAYNLLWWQGRVVVIDLPQAVEFVTNSDAFELLHRDVANVGDWFNRHGLEVDVEAVYADLLPLAW